MIILLFKLWDTKVNVLIHYVYIWLKMKYEQTF